MNRVTSLKISDEIIRNLAVLWVLSALLKIWHQSKFVRYYFAAIVDLLSIDWNNGIAPQRHIASIGHNDLTHVLIVSHICVRELGPVKFESEFYQFQSRKCIWNCRLPRWRPFCSGRWVNLCPFLPPGHWCCRIMRRSGLLAFSSESTLRNTQ